MARYLARHHEIKIDIKKNNMLSLQIDFPAVLGGPEKTEETVLSVDLADQSANDRSSLFVFLPVITHNGLCILPLTCEMSSLFFHSMFHHTCLSLSPSAAAAAQSLQSCPTLCDPIDGSSPGSPVPGSLHARTLEWVAISFSNAWK